MKLNEICEVYSGYALKEFNDVEDGLPVIKIGNICIDGTLNLEECQYTTEGVDKKYYSNRGDVYIALSGATTGKVGIMDTNDTYVINQRVGIVRQKTDDIPQEYIKYFLLRQNDRIFKEAAGCAQPNISPKQIAEYIVPDISKDKMHERCAILNKIKNIIDGRNAEISALDNLIKARFVEMFGNIYNNRLGFDVVTLQDVSTMIKDGTHQTPTYTTDVENGYKFLSSKDVTTGKVDWSHLKYIPEKLHRELYTRISPRKGDILLAKNGTTGIAAIVDRDEVFDIYVSLALIRPYGVDATYLWAAINAAETKQQFDASLKGIGVPNLHLNEIKKARIILPPIELQNQFAAFVHQVDKSKVAVKKALDETQLLFDSLMQKYFG